MFFTLLAESDIDCLGSSQQNVGVLVALLQNNSCNQFSCSAEPSLAGTAADWVREEREWGGREGGTNPISAGDCYEADITVVSFIDKVTSLTFVPK